MLRWAAQVCLGRSRHEGTILVEAGPWLLGAAVLAQFLGQFAELLILLLELDPHLSQLYIFEFILSQSFL